MMDKDKIRMWQNSLIELEESLAGKPYVTRHHSTAISLTGLAITISAISALFGPSGLFEMASIAIEGGEVNGRQLPQASPFYSYLYATISRSIPVPGLLGHHDDPDQANLEQDLWCCLPRPMRFMDRPDSNQVREPFRPRRGRLGGNLGE